MDSDEELRELKRAVAAHKRNRKYQTNKSAGQKPKTENFPRGNPTAKPPNKSDSKKVIFTELPGFDSSDFQDLIKYFISPICHDEKPHKKKLNIDYEKQGAIPKTKTNHWHKRNQANSVTKEATRRELPLKNDKSISDVRENRVNYNSKRETEMGNTVVEKIYSEPFYYIVPKKPSTNFVLPSGSYYVIPRAPSPLSSEKIIIHPEKSSASSPQLRDWESSPPVIYDRGSREGRGDQAENLSLNNLGKGSPQREDSHLNIGPAQEKERCTISNLESNWEWSKTYDKTVSTSPKTSPEDLGRKKENVLPNPRTDEGESDGGEFAERVVAVRQRLMSEFPDFSPDLAENVARDYWMDEESLEEYIASRRKDLKIQQQFNRMLKALPESLPDELLEKSIEFQGDEEQELAYIEELKLKNKRQKLVMEMQMIIPDVDPNFLLDNTDTLLDDPAQVNDFALQLLETQNYPKISENGSAIHRKLWRTYVENFKVDSFLRKVPDPEAFAGPSGNHNKADLKLIMKFLRTRYPGASELYLANVFNSHQENMTKTCANLTEYEAVPLSESGFEAEDFTEGFLMEACYIDRREEIDNHIQWQKERREMEAAEARLDEAFLSCPLCAEEELLASEAVTCPEGDVFCGNCIKRYVTVKISDGVYKFACPLNGCKSFFPISTLEHMLPETVVSMVIQRQQAEELVTAEVDGLEFCTNCHFAYIPNPNDKLFRCLNPSCMAEICRDCGEKNHIPLRCEEVEKPADVEARKKIEEAMTEKLVRKCPSCLKRILKIDGCNKIVCTCGKILCYVCREVIRGYDHFENRGGLCPLYSNNSKLHVTEVREEGIRVRDQILRENPNIRIFNDPTEDGAIVENRKIFF